MHLVVQHKKPTAIAQIHQYLAAKKSDALHIASVPLIKYYLASQALRAVYIPVRDQGDLDVLDALDDTAELVVIGSHCEVEYQRRLRRFTTIRMSIACGRNSQCTSINSPECSAMKTFDANIHIWVAARLA